MSWKTAHRSFYYANAEPPDDIRLDPAATALLVIDIQNTYLKDQDTPEETARWAPFFERMRATVIPNTLVESLGALISLYLFATASSDSEKKSGG